MWFIVNNMKKVMYPITKTMTCPRCKRKCRHVLYDYNYNIYKCTECNDIHA